MENPNYPYIERASVEHTVEEGMVSFWHVLSDKIDLPETVLLEKAICPANFPIPSLAGKELTTELRLATLREMFNYRMQDLGNGTFRHIFTSRPDPLVELTKRLHITSCF